MARRKEFYIATQQGFIDGTFTTKTAARKALAEIVRDDAKRCRRSHERCSVVGSVKSDGVQIKIGGRQGYHLWDRYIIKSR